MKRTINVLGTKYYVYTDVSVYKDKSLENRFGYCTPTMRRIVVADLNTIDGWKDEPFYSKMVQQNETLRHEIIHAFLYESGLWGCNRFEGAWSMNEEMVDWLATQFPKILKVFEKLGCADI